MKVLYNLWKSLRKARKIIREFKPDAVVGVGGYASGPIGRVAAEAGIPLILQEQNSYAGVTNKLLAKKACKSVFLKKRKLSLPVTPCGKICYRPGKSGLKE